MKTNTGTYKVVKIGSAYFAAFEFNDGELLFLSKSYRTDKGANSRLKNHLKAANLL
jgi:murein L,D-transpeptidase YcbB/YkuD